LEATTVDTLLESHTLQPPQYQGLHLYDEAKPIVSSTLLGMIFFSTSVLSFLLSHSLLPGVVPLFIYLFVYLLGPVDYMALDPTFGSFTLLELVSHYE
jgi:hypothetical protein